MGLLFKLSNLTTLSLDNCETISNSSMNAVARLPALESLNLDSCCIRDEHITQLTAVGSSLSCLCALNLCYTEITDIGLCTVCLIISTWLTCSDSCFLPESTTAKRGLLLFTELSSL